MIKVIKLRLFSVTGIMISMLFFLFCQSVSAADVKEATAVTYSVSDVKIFFAFAAIASVGISCITSAYALSKIGAAALGAMSEKPEIGGRALVFLGMAEGIAIYGLIVAIMILNKI